MFGWLGRPPQFPQDLMVSIDAALAHDGEEALRALKAETLVTGGTADPVFPPYLMQDTADMIEGAEFELYEGGGHAALDQYRKEFEPLLLRFIQHGAKPA